MVRPHMKQKQQQAVAAAAAAAAAAASEDNIPKASSSKITLDEAVEDTPPTEPPPIIPPTQSSPPSPPVLRPRAGTSIAAESPEPTSGVSEGSQKKSYSRPNSSKNKPKRITDPTLLWPCRINDCDKVFQREADLKRHQRTVVGHEMPGFVRDLVCKHCKLSFTRTDALKRHIKVRGHHPDLPIGTPKDSAPRRTSRRLARRSRSASAKSTRGASSSKGTVNSEEEELDSADEEGYEEDGTEGRDVESEDENAGLRDENEVTRSLVPRSPSPKSATLIDTTSKSLVNGGKEASHPSQDMEVDDEIVAQDATSSKERDTASPNTTSPYEISSPSDRTSPDGVPVPPPSSSSSIPSKRKAPSIARASSPPNLPPRKPIDFSTSHRPYHIPAHPGFSLAPGYATQAVPMYIPQPYPGTQPYPGAYYSAIPAPGQIPTHPPHDANPMGMGIPGMYTAAHPSTNHHPYPYPYMYPTFIPEYMPPHPQYIPPSSGPPSHLPMAQPGFAYAPYPTPYAPAYYYPAPPPPQAQAQPESEPRRKRRKSRRDSSPSASAKSAELAPASSETIPPAAIVEPSPQSSNSVNLANPERSEEPSEVPAHSPSTPLVDSHMDIEPSHESPPEPPTQDSNYIEDLHQPSPNPPRAAAPPTPAATPLRSQQSSRPSTPLPLLSMAEPTNITYSPPKPLPMTSPATPVVPFAAYYKPLSEFDARGNKLPRQYIPPWVPVLPLNRSTLPSKSQDLETNLGAREKTSTTPGTGGIDEPQQIPTPGSQSSQSNTTTPAPIQSPSNGPSKATEAFPAGPRSASDVPQSHVKARRETPSLPPTPTSPVKPNSSTSASSTIGPSGSNQAAKAPESPSHTKPIPIPHPTPPFSLYRPQPPTASIVGRTFGKIEYTPMGLASFNLAKSFSGGVNKRPHDATSSTPKASASTSSSSSGSKPKMNSAQQPPMAMTQPSALPRIPPPPQFPYAHYPLVAIDQTVPRPTLAPSAGSYYRPSDYRVWVRPPPSSAAEAYRRQRTPSPPPPPPHTDMNNQEFVHCDPYMTGKEVQARVVGEGELMNRQPLDKDIQMEEIPSSSVQRPSTLPSSTNTTDVARSPRSAGVEMQEANMRDHRDVDRRRETSVPTGTPPVSSSVSITSRGTPAPISTDRPVARGGMDLRRLTINDLLGEIPPATSRTDVSLISGPIPVPSSSSPLGPNMNERGPLPSSSSSVSLSHSLSGTGQSEPSNTDPEFFRKIFFPISTPSNTRKPRKFSPHLYQPYPQRSPKPAPSSQPPSDPPPPPLPAPIPPPPASPAQPPPTPPVSMSDQLLGMNVNFITMPGVNAVAIRRETLSGLKTISVKRPGVASGEDSDTARSESTGA